MKAVGLIAGLAAAGGLVYILTRPAEAQPAIPNIELASLTWDAIPPFETGSRHEWTLVMQNLAVGRLTYQLKMFINGEWLMDYSANLVADEVKEYSQPITFGIEGTYTLTIQAFYDDQLLDEISSIVTVEAPPPPEVIDGKFLIGHYTWGWEAGVYEVEFIQLSDSGQYEIPADSFIATIWKVKNTGNMVSTFSVEFMGQMSPSIVLSPGETGWIGEEPNEFWTPLGSPSTYAFTPKLYADDILVDSFPTITIVAVEPIELVSYPAAKVVSWYWTMYDFQSKQWVRRDPPFPTWTPFGMMITLESLSESPFSVWANASCVDGAFSKSGEKLGDLSPGGTKEFPYSLIPDMEFTTVDTVIVTLMDENWNTLDTIQAPFSIV